MGDKKIVELVCKDWSDFRRRLEGDVYKRGFFVSGEFLYRGSPAWTINLRPPLTDGTRDRSLSALLYRTNSFERLARSATGTPG